MVEFCGESATFFHRIMFLLKRMSIIPIIVIQTWVFGRYFLNDGTLSLQGKKLTIFVANDEI